MTYQAFDGHQRLNMHHSNTALQRLSSAAAYSLSGVMAVVLLLCWLCAQSLHQ